jgi:hypothetical protein
MEIDKLSIEIESNASNASGEIDKLAGSLGKLKNNLNGISSLKSLSTTLKNLSTVAKGINTAQFVQLANGMDRLASSFTGLNGFKTGATGLLKQIADIKVIASDLGDTKFDKFTEDINKLKTAIQPLQDLGKTNLGSFFNQLKKLPEISKQLDTVDFNKFSSQMKQLANAIKPLNGVSIKLGRAFSNLPWHIKKATTQMESYSRSASKASKTSGSLMSRLGKSVASFRTMTFVIQGVVGALTSVFEESSQYVENLNLFNVAMGETTQSALDFANKVQGAMGIDTSEWMSFQGRLNNLITGFDVASDKAQIMSQNLTQLAYDYSSLMNVDPSESFDKINSAMSGQIKGLKDYGNNVSVAMVKQTGLKYGLEGAVSEWDQNTQAIMRYITIMNNASKVDVFNDMARTIATPANAVRILTQQFTMLKRAVGNIASVFISKLIPYVQIAVQWLTALANTIANFFGFELPKIDYSGIAGGGGALDDVEDSANGASDAVGGTADKVKELKKQLMGFDELNIINKPDDSSDSGSGGSGGAGGGGSIGDIELPQYDFLKGLENQTNEMMERLAKKMAEMFKPVTNSWNKYGKGVLDSIEYQWTEIGKLVDSIGVSFGTVWQNGTGEETMDHIFSIITNINITVGNLAKQFRTAWDEAGNGTQIVQNLWDSFNVFLGLIDDISRDLVKLSDTLDFKPAVKSVVNFTDAFKDLSTTISKLLYGGYKNVLEPLAKWSIEKAVPSLVDSLSKAVKGLSKVLDALRPTINIIEKVATALLKMAGNTVLKAIDLLASAVDGIGSMFKKFPGLMTGVTTAVGAFITAWKVDQLISTNTKINTIIASLKLIPSAVTSVKSVGFTQAMSDWASASFGASNAISSLISFGSKLNSIDGPLKAVSLGFGSLATKAESAFGASNLLSTGLTFLASNPLVAVVGGLTAISIACVALIGDSNNLTREQEKQIEKFRKSAEESRKLAEEYKKIADAQKEANEEADKNAKAVNTQYETVMVYKNELSKLVDENGRVNGSMELAKYYVDKINEALGTNISITGGVIDNWKEEQNQIIKTVELMKQRALLASYEGEYVKAKKDEADANLALAQAQETALQKQRDYNVVYNEYIDKLLGYGITMDDINAKNTAYGDALSKLMLQYPGLSVSVEEAKKALDESNNTLSEAEQRVANNTEALNNYSAVALGTSGTIEGVTASICEQYGKMTTDGHYTYSSLASGLNDLSLVCDENGERWKMLSATEQQASKEARVQLLNDLAEKAYASGKTYEDMLVVAKEKGAKLTGTDKEYLRQQYANLTKANADKLTELEKTYNLTASQKTIANSKLTKADKEALDKITEQWKKSGNEQGLGLIKNLADQIKKDNGKVTDESKKIMENIEKQADEANPEVNVKLKSPSDTELQKISDKVSGVKPKVTIDFSLAKRGIKLNTSANEVKFATYANGGFPDMGQMFVAREAGPELVGRIGKKTAVANNDQIVSAVSGGVYNAMRSAMAGMSGGGKFEIHTTVEIDKKAVGKSVVDYNNGIVKQTGKSPLLI